jgi:hypothetical protein
MQVLINGETDNLIKEPEAFRLLFLIAYRQKRNDDFRLPELEIGESFLRGFEDCGLSSIQSYRTAKKNLKKWGFASFRNTNKGTIAKITTNKFFREE